jgi:NADH-quinone oxidoreductase subunit H
VRLREGTRPTRIDPWMYGAGPVLAFTGVCLAAVVLPFGPDLVPRDLGIGLFYFIVVVDFVVLGIALGGWGANATASVEACYRAVAQLVAYLVPLGLAVLGPVMMARSLSTVDIVEAQREAGLWYGLVQPLGFALYLATGLMQAYRAPFLEPFAGRLEGGVLGAFRGPGALLWRLALSGLLFVVAAMGAVLFLGGYVGPLLPGPVWMGIKTVAVMALMLRLGRRLPLLGTAEMLALSWKLLIPLGMANVLLVGGLILLGVGQPGAGATGGM